MKWHRLPQKANIIFSIKYSRPILGLLILEKNGKINIWFLLPYLCGVITQNHFGICNELSFFSINDTKKSQ